MTNPITIDIGGPVDGEFVEELRSRGLMDQFLELAGDIEHEKFDKSGHLWSRWTQYGNVDREGLVADAQVPSVVDYIIDNVTNSGAYSGRLQDLVDYRKEHGTRGFAMRTELVNLGLFGLVSAYDPESRETVNPQVETDLLNFALMSAQNLHPLSRSDRDSMIVTPHIIGAYCRVHDIDQLAGKIAGYFQQFAPQRFQGD